MTLSPPKLFEMPVSSSSRSIQTISTRDVPSRPCGTRIHQHDEDHADEDEPRDARLDDEAVLPDEGGEAERRDHREPPLPAVQQREPEHCEHEQDEGDVPDHPGIRRGAAPSPGASCRACRRPTSGRRRCCGHAEDAIACTAIAEAERAAEHDREPPPRAVLVRGVSPRGECRRSTSRGPGVRRTSSDTFTTRAPRMTPPRLPTPPRMSIA